MKVSYEWLKEWVDTAWSPAQTAQALTQLGFPVDSITITGMTIKNIVAAKILNVEKHPNADKLQLATVFDGKGERLVVCGAPNIASGQIVPLALPGTVFPDGLEIKVSKIRGVESHGMLCSERELGLSTEHAGILMLPQDATPGQEVSDILGNGDAIFELDITPNRSDAMCHVGLARELAALLSKPLKRLSTSIIASGTSQVSISIEAPDKCPRYIGRVIENVTIGPSPDWLKKRLERCGVRSINNVVDITNFVLLEWGHPLHAFDLSTLPKRSIVVRPAKSGESLLALDGKEYKLQPDDLVIADDQKPVALAGIMGGERSGVTERTTSIFLESAVFEPSSIWKTSKRQGLRSESSIRFEKGSNAKTAEMASLRSTQLIMEIAGGKPGPLTDKWPIKKPAAAVPLRRPQIKRLTGHEIADADVEKILTSLEIVLKNTSEGWVCEAPPHRTDINIEADLIEEVLRFDGYDKVPSALPVVAIGNNDAPSPLIPPTQIAQTLKGLGFSEVLTSSFANPSFLNSFLGREVPVAMLANPLSQEDSALRPFLAPNLLKSIQRNIHVQRSDVRLFEIGPVFNKTSIGELIQEERLCVVATGSADINFYFIKGLWETLAQRFGLNLTLQNIDDAAWLHPSQGLGIFQGKTRLGHLGLIHPVLGASLDIKGVCAILEMDTNPFIKRPLSFTPPPRFSFVERDMAVVVDKATNWSLLETQVRQSAGPLLKSVSPFDVFEGGNLPAEKKSVAFRLRLQDPDKTLTDADINSCLERVQTALKKACGADLR